MVTFPNHLRYIHPELTPPAAHPWTDIAIHCKAHRGQTLGSITNELALPNSPLRSYLASRFPCLGAVCQQYRRRARFAKLQVTCDPKRSHFIGTAFDIVISALLAPEVLRADFESYARGFNSATESTRALTAILAAVPLSLEPPHRERFLRSCLIRALFAEAARGGVADEYRQIQMTPPEEVAVAFDLIRDDDLASLDELVALTEVTILDTLRSAGTYLPDVTDFASPGHVAILDGIADHTLIELKTNLGPRRPDGTRWSTMDTSQVRQLIGYVLRDWEDAYALERVFWYQARYATGITWDIDYLLDTAAGQRVSLERLRDEYRQLVMSACVPEPPARRPRSYDARR